MKNLDQTSSLNPDNSINIHFSSTGEEIGTLRASTGLHADAVPLLGLRAADKSGGRLRYVNTTGSSARYSQLLLHDLSRDLMLISKKTESCRLSMALSQKLGSTAGGKSSRRSSATIPHTPHTAPCVPL